MKRYRFLQKDDMYDALNRLRDAFLAAKNGEEVEEIINGLLTYDEKMKLGRRILIAKLIKDGMGYDEIVNTLKVGKNTIISIIRSLDQHPVAFKLIEKRRQKVEKVYQKNNLIKLGGSQLIFKKKIYSEFSRKNVER